MVLVILLAPAVLPLVRDNIRRAPLTLDVEDSLSISARLLRVARVTGAPVKDDNSVTGILSRNDLLRRVSHISADVDPPELGKQLAPIKGSPLWKILEPNARIISPSATLVDAAKLMTEMKVNRLMVKTPVSDVLGVISSTDIVFSLFELAGLLDDESVQATDCPTYECPTTSGDDTNGLQRHMATSLVFCSPDMRVVDAARMLKKARVTGAPVLGDANEVVGVLSRADLLQALADISPDADFKTQIEAIGARDVGSVLDTSFEKIAPDASMLEAAKIMAERKLNRLLVTAPDGLRGLVSASDAVFALLGAEDAEEDDSSLLEARFEQDRVGHAASVY